MGSAALAEAAKSIRDWSLNDRPTTARVKATEAFGSLCFNDKLQQERLSKAAYRALRATITRGEPLDVATADAVAAALKDWALEHGATHYTHWFQPMTGITAEKHDCLVYARDLEVTGSPVRVNPHGEALEHGMCVWLTGHRLPLMKPLYSRVINHRPGVACPGFFWSRLA